LIGGSYDVKDYDPTATNHGEDKDEDADAEYESVEDDGGNSDYDDEEDQ